jgi:hypothetical protein
MSKPFRAHGENVRIKKRADRKEGNVLRTETPELRQLDVLGAWAFRAVGFRVGNPLAFAQIVKLNALKAFGVKEQILARFSLDEPKAPVRQLLDCAFCHDFAFEIVGLDDVTRQSFAIRMPSRCGRLYPVNMLLGKAFSGKKLMPLPA